MWFLFEASEVVWGFIDSMAMDGYAKGNNRIYKGG